jgi:hypothetical protein
MPDSFNKFNSKSGFELDINNVLSKIRLDFDTNVEYPLNYILGINAEQDGFILIDPNQLTNTNQVENTLDLAILDNNMLGNVKHYVFEKLIDPSVVGCSNCDEITNVKTVFTDTGNLPILNRDVIAEFEVNPNAVHSLEVDLVGHRKICNESGNCFDNWTTDTLQIPSDYKLSVSSDALSEMVKEEREATFPFIDYSCCKCCEATDYYGDLYFNQQITAEQFANYLTSACNDFNLYAEVDGVIIQSFADYCGSSRDVYNQQTGLLESISMCGLINNTKNNYGSGIDTSLVNCSTPADTQTVSASFFAGSGTGGGDTPIFNPCSSEACCASCEEICCCLASGGSKECELCSGVSCGIDCEKLLGKPTDADYGAFCCNLDPSGNTPENPCGGSDCPDGPPTCGPCETSIGCSCDRNACPDTPENPCGARTSTPIIDQCGCVTGFECGSCPNTCSSCETSGENCSCTTKPCNDATNNCGARSGTPITDECGCITGWQCGGCTSGCSNCQTQSGDCSCTTKPCTDATNPCGSRSGTPITDECGCITGWQCGGCTNTCGPCETQGSDCSCKNECTDAPNSCPTNVCSGGPAVTAIPTVGPCGCITSWECKFPPGKKCEPGTFNCITDENSRCYDECNKLLGAPACCCDEGLPTQCNKQVDSSFWVCSIRDTIGACGEALTTQELMDNDCQICVQSTLGCGDTIPPCITGEEAPNGQCTSNVYGTKEECELALLTSACKGSWDCVDGTCKRFTDCCKGRYTSEEACLVGTQGSCGKYQCLQPAQSCKTCEFVTNTTEGYNTIEECHANTFCNKETYNCVSEKVCPNGRVIENQCVPICEGGTYTSSSECENSGCGVIDYGPRWTCNSGNCEYVDPCDGDGIYSSKEECLITCGGVSCINNKCTKVEGPGQFPNRQQCSQECECVVYLNVNGGAGGCSVCEKVCGVDKLQICTGCDQFGLNCSSCKNTFSSLTACEIYRRDNDLIPHTCSGSACIPTDQFDERLNKNCGNYCSKSACEATCKIPSGYDCVRKDLISAGVCEPAYCGAGQFKTLTECNIACVAPPSCGYNCVPSPTNPRINVCKSSCQPSPDGETVPVIPGQFQTLQQCKQFCISDYGWNCKGNTCEKATDSPGVFATYDECFNKCIVPNQAPCGVVPKIVTRR